MHEKPLTLNAISDNFLMLKVKDGDLDQLSLLFERYHRSLFSYFYQLTSNTAECEDLVQNVFYRILKYRHQFRGDGEFKAWVFHIAKNVGLDRFKKKRPQALETIENWQERLEDQTPNQIQKLMEQDDLDLLKRALQLLEADKREVLVMSKLQGMKYKEIGDILGCEENAVKVRVFRALKALREVFFSLKQ